MEEAGKGDTVFQNLCPIDERKSSTYHPALQDERETFSTVISLDLFTYPKHFFYSLKLPS